MHATDGGWEQLHLPCPKCPSSDGYSIHSNGQGHCFICQHHTFPNSDFKQDNQTTGEVRLTAAEQNMIVGGSHIALRDKNDPLLDRSISKESCEFFDVKVIRKDDKTAIILPFFDSEGKLIAQKIRTATRPKGAWRGNPKDATMFGMNKFNGGNTITITEGELDALAFRELSGDYPVVSIRNGAQAATVDIKKHFDYLSRFNKIYICFDNDEVGQRAAQQVADLFPIGKVKIVKLRHYKDANEYLQHGAVEQFKKCWWNAEDYTPAGIEAASKGGFDSLFEDVDGLELFPYPYDKLNETTFGLRKGEMVTMVAGSGSGKSAVIGEIAFKLLTETNKKVGMLMLEESVKKTKLRLMSLYLDKPLHLTLLGRLAKSFPFLEKVLDNIFEDASSYEFDDETRKDLQVAWDHVIDKKAADGQNQLWLFNHFGSNNIDTIVHRIDAMVTGLGCEFIFLDHISIVVSDQQAGDERKALDELATKLRSLVERRNFALIIVSHLRRPGGKPHEEGGETSLSDIRGTAGIGQLSDIVIGLERDGQHTDEYLRNVMKMRVLKNRFAGFTGLTSYAHYDKVSGRLLEVDAVETQKLFDEDGGKDDFTDSTESPFDKETPVTLVPEVEKVK